MNAKKLSELLCLSARLLVNAQPSSIDEELIRTVFGAIVFTSLVQVAMAFGVEATTVKNTWRPNGMPGVAQRGPGAKGNYNLADIVIWLLKRNSSASAARGTDEFTGRIRFAEARSAEALAKIKEHKAEVITGQYTSTQVAVAVVRARANLLRDALMMVAKKMSPSFPAKYQQQCTADLERHHHDALQAFSEGSIHDLQDLMEKNKSDV